MGSACCGGFPCAEWAGSAEGEFHRLDAVFPELCADAREEHGFHLLQLEAEGGLRHAEDEVAAFDGNGLGVAGDEIAGKFLPGCTDLVLVESVLGTGGAEDGCDELLCEVDARVEIRRFIRTPPFPEDFLTDFAGAWRFLHRWEALTRHPRQWPRLGSLPWLRGIGQVLREFPAV